MPLSKIKRLRARNITRNSEDKQIDKAGAKIVPKTDDIIESCPDAKGYIR
jgi:hypothetical protein